LDKLTIDTPEQVPLEFMVAGLGSRFMAIFLDTIIQVIIYIVLIAIALGLAIGVAFWEKASLWVISLAFFVVFGVYWGYFTAFEILWKGQTPGKRWAGIRVIKDTGRPINAFEAIARNLIRIFDYFPGFYGVGIVTMLLNAKHQRLGDFVAGTLVVHETSDREPQMFFNHTASPEFPLPQAARLTLQEAELIETFLARRLDLTPQVRVYNAGQIAGMVAARLGIQPESRPAKDEAFLELLVQEFRNRARYQA
jgi:uncharacterized RDD family membrane protein YckC